MMRRRITIALFGKWGAGKSEVARILEDTYNAKIYSTEEQTRSFLSSEQKQDLRVRRDLHYWRRMMYQKRGLLYLAEDFLERTGGTASFSVRVFDHASTPEEIARLSRLPSFRAIEVIATESKRIRNAVKRMRNGPTLQFEDFREFERSMITLRHTTPWIIENRTNFVHLRAEVHRVMYRIQEEVKSSPRRGSKKE
ncbi:hypothetical protein ACFL2D_00520 [Patescibacteria group bacterium]